MVRYCIMVAIQFAEVPTEYYSLEYLSHACVGFTTRLAHSCPPTILV